MAAPFPLFLEVRCVWRAEGAAAWREGEFQPEGKEANSDSLRCLVDSGRAPRRLSRRQRPVPIPERRDPRFRRGAPCLTL